MKRIAEASIPDLFGRVLLALSLFYGAGGTLWKIFGLDTLRTAWMVQVFTGTALCVFLCAGLLQPPRCLSKAATTYIISYRNEDSLSKKSSAVGGTLTPLM